MKRKTGTDEDWDHEELAIPLPIQTFLWRQSSPFIRPKLGKLHEATCMFCQNAPSHHEIKESSKTLEKVLVQNILFGMSDWLTGAIKSVPRWRFIQAAVPHVMHCAAALLYNRRESTIHSLGAAETKMLYTLHWIILDAAEECADADAEKGLAKTCQFYYLFSMQTIQVFVYLFAPLLHTIKESDFQNFRLENGLKIWTALWEYRHPDVPAFTTPVRPRRQVLKGKRVRKSHTQFGDVFLGTGGHAPNREREDDLMFLLGGGIPASRSTSPPMSDATSSATTVHDSRTIPDAEKLEEELRLLTSSREATFPETIPEETSSTEEEHVVIFRLGSYPDNDGFKNSHIYKAEHPSSILRPPTVEISDPNGSSLPPSVAASTPECHTPRKDDPLNYKKSFGNNGSGNGVKVSSLEDPTLATFLDIAIIRCLFVSQWLEEGVYWALNFIYKRAQRLQDIGEETGTTTLPRRRSNSLPIPKIHVSLHTDSVDTTRPKEDQPEDQSASDNYISDSPFLMEYSRRDCHTIGGSNRKKKKISELKAFVDSKLRSRSEKALEKIGHDDSTSRQSSFSDDQAHMEGSHDDLGGSTWEIEGEVDRGRPQSALDKLQESSVEHHDNDRPPQETQRGRSQGLLVKGKSMPSLSSLLDELPCLGYFSEDRGERHMTALSGPPETYVGAGQPIITVTQHTPSPTEHGGWRDQVSTCGSLDSHYGIAHKHPPPLARSLTDSNIQYTQEEAVEAPGSTHYINREGHISLHILLKAAQSVSKRDANVCSLRTCEILLHLLDLLLDLGILKNCKQFEKMDNGGDEDSSECGYKPKDEKEEQKPHYIFMDCIFRIFRHLGCPHGCGDSHRGLPADFLRHTGQALLGRLYRSDQSAFRRFLRGFVTNPSLAPVLDFFHSFLGFCVDSNSLLSPMIDQRPKSKNCENQQGGYATNFGQSLGGAGSKGIEGQLIACVFKSLISRFVKSHKDINSHKNIPLNVDVRQLLGYISENHGGVFRRVVLSGLIDSADRPHKQNKKIQTTRVVRRVTVDDDLEIKIRDSPLTSAEDGGDGSRSRKGLFKKKSTSSSITSVLKKAPSVSSVYDDNLEDSPLGSSPASTLRRRPRNMVGGRADNDHLMPNSRDPKPRRVSKIVSWLRGRSTEGAGNLELPDIPPALMRRFSHGAAHKHRPSRPHFTTKPGTGLTSLQIIKRMEAHIAGRKSKKEFNYDETPDPSRRNSLDIDGGIREASVVLVRERKLVSTGLVNSGMLRFNFLLETCQPGHVPDPQLIAAVIDLPGAPVVARASFLLEVAHFVHRCNRGAWPNWIKDSIPVYRSSQPAARHSPLGPRRTHILQRHAGRMFYQWAEALGSRLEEILDSSGPTVEDICGLVPEGEARRHLRSDDEEEDFLDEVSVNPDGNNTPMALKLIAVQLLLEITSFLRETYTNLPKSSSRMSVRDRSAGWGPSTVGYLSNKDPNRRWSMALSSMGYSPAQSLQSIGEGHPVGYSGERKISFALHEADNVSLGSSNTTLTSSQHGDEERRRNVSTGRGHFLKKAGGGNNSFKRRSYKLKRNANRDTDAGFDNNMKRSDSIRSQRKVSAVSERSDASEHCEQEISGEESPGVLSNEEAPESPTDGELDDESLTSHMPWLKVVVRLSSLYNMTCTHQSFCHPYCYRRNMRACKRLVHAVRKVYGEEFEEQDEEMTRDSEHNQKKAKKARKSSHQDHGSPLKRKDSFLRKDNRIDKNVDISAVLSRLGHNQGSSIHLSKDTINTDRGTVEDNLKENVQKEEEKKKEKKKKKEDTPIIKYIKTQVMGLFHSPFSVVCKSVAVLPEDLLLDIIPQAWELLLEHDNEVCASAAVVFILGGVRVPTHVSDIMTRELTHSDPNTRLNAILRFQVLWRSRYQAWPRMEEGGHMTFKVPPHGIEFTLPSPKIGVESLPVVDPPWMPHFKTNAVQEVTINSVQHSMVTATNTRRKQQEVTVKNAMEEEEARRRKERENFLLTTVPVTIQAAYEPAFHHVSADDHEEGEESEMELSRGAQHVSVAQQLFPSCLCSAVLTIIHLLDDPAVTPDGVAVYEVAQQVIWSCLVEDSALFLRFFLEKLTRNRQDVMIRLLRRLVRFIPTLPSQAAFALYNYMVGYVMFYVRTPQEGSQEFIAAALSVLWTVIPSIQGILFKDLKQIFRKEQCDASLLVTANVPSAKKIIVHGPGGMDAGGIPSQFPIQEDTQFIQILQESLDFFSILENEHKCYFLVDHKTNQMHNPQAYVRDFYFFKRSQYPQLLMVRMEPEAAYNALQQQAFMQKLLEIGKILMAWSILKRPDQVAQRVFFLHEELTKLPSFPRKALEADFSLYKGGEMGKELRGLDQLHKYMWVMMVSRMFEGMAGNLTYTTDVHLFLNVINGALLLHCEDSSMIRVCMAAYINAAHHFKNLFSTNGYLLCMPTILRVYSNYESNRMVVSTIEFVVKQLYILHRKPFILQMLGSVAPILDMDETSTYGDANKIRPQRLFELLLSLEKHHEDPLHILDLVTVDKPLRALDFCYHEECDNVSLLETVDMCVTVIAYSSDSRRGRQMLTILEAILGLVLRHQQAQAGRDLRQEKETIHHVAVAIKTLLCNCEMLAKNYTGPQSSHDGKGSSRVTHGYSKVSKAYNPAIEVDDDSHSKYMSDSKRFIAYERDIEDSENLRQEFRQPRDTLLHVVAEFLSTCSARLQEINKKLGHENKQSELLDNKCHMRLSEVAHSLLKVAPYDPVTMGCRGLQRYMNEILPHPDWSHEDLRPALSNILRRLDKMFTKIAKTSFIRRMTDWSAAANLLKGVYTTLAKYPYIAHLPILKQVVQVCQSLILGERMSDVEGGAGAAAWTQTPPPHFCSMVVKIVAMQILAMGLFSDVTGVTYSLEHCFGGTSLFPTTDKTENIIINFLLPLVLRVGCGRKGAPKMRLADISFALTVILHAMNPPLAKIAPLHGHHGGTNKGTHAGATEHHARSQSYSHAHGDSRPTKVKPTILRIAFLGLKVMLVCFEKQLSQDWHRILYCLRDMDQRGEGGISLWDFLDFVSANRTPLFIQMRPFIIMKIQQKTLDESIEQYREIVRERVLGWSLLPPTCRGTLLSVLAHEVKLLKEQVITEKISVFAKYHAPQFLAPGDLDARPSQIESQDYPSRRPRLSYADPPSDYPTRPLASPPPRSKGSVSSSNSGCSAALQRELSMRSEPLGPPNRTQLLPETQIPRRTSYAGDQQQQLAKGESSSISSCTSPVGPEGGAGSGPGSGAGSQESLRSGGGKHRLQRQMAQSRKTFRFRKSRHGSSEEKQPQVAHIEVEPTHVTLVTAGQIGAVNNGTEDPQLQELSVSCIPKDDFGTQNTPNARMQQSKTSRQQSVICVEAESVSEVSCMETSNISGYAEGGFDMSLQELERLDAQVRSGRYQVPLSEASNISRPGRKATLAEGTNFQDRERMQIEMQSVGISSRPICTQQKSSFPNLPCETIHQSKTMHLSKSAQVTVQSAITIAEVVHEGKESVTSVQQSSGPHDGQPIQIDKKCPISQSSAIFQSQVPIQYSKAKVSRQSDHISIPICVSDQCDQQKKDSSSWRKSRPKEISNEEGIDHRLGLSQALITSNVELQEPSRTHSHIFEKTKQAKELNVVSSKKNGDKLEDIQSKLDHKESISKDDMSCSGEKTSLLNPFQQDTPTERSLLIAPLERDEDTLI